jgi:hypothetical protein
MNLSAIKSGAILAGVTIGGGAAVGAGIGLVQSLNSEPTADAKGFTSMEQRSVLANTIIGAGVGALGGVALLGAKKLFTINALRGLPMPGLLALSAGTGAAAYGAYTLGRNIAN